RPRRRCDRLSGFLSLHRFAEHPGPGAAVSAAQVSGPWGPRSMSAEIDLERILCRLEDLSQDGCREFRLGEGDWPLRGFVVRVPDGVRAYVNRCAHLDNPLNYLPHEFLTHD